MSDAPTAQVPVPTPEEMTAVDARGRKFKLRILDPGDTLDLLEAAGSASDTAGYMRYAMIVASVAEIDAVPVPIARTREQLRGNAKRIGNDGIVAVTQVLFGTAVVAEADAAADTAKN